MITNYKNVFKLRITNWWSYLDAIRSGRWHATVDLVVAAATPRGLEGAAAAGGESLIIITTSTTSCNPPAERNRHLRIDRKKRTNRSQITRTLADGSSSKRSSKAKLLSTGPHFEGCSSTDWNSGDSQASKVPADCREEWPWVRPLYTSGRQGWYLEAVCGSAARLGDLAPWVDWDLKMGKMGEGKMELSGETERNVAEAATERLLEGH